MNIAFFSDSYLPYFSGLLNPLIVSKRTGKGHFVYIFAPDYPSVDEEEGIYRFASLPTPTKKISGWLFPSQ